MHGRQSSRVRALLRVRSASTAAALKPAPQSLGKWEKLPDSSAKQAPLALGKWARAVPAPSQASGSQDAGPSYQPNVNKWARQPIAERSGAPRKSALDDFDTSRRSSRPSNPFGERDRSQPRYGDGRPRQAQQFPADSSSQRFSKDSETGPPTRRNSDRTDAFSQRDSKGTSSSREDPQGRERPPHSMSSKGKEVNRQNESIQSSDTETQKRDSNYNDQDNERRESRPTRQQRPARSTYSDGYSSEVQFDSMGGKNRGKRGQRDSFKDRGSVIERLMSGESIEIPKHSRMNGDKMDPFKKMRKKPREAKPVTDDVIVPSIISVGNLARLLDVRLDALQRCMLRNGMDEQSSYDYMLSADDASLLAMEFNKNPIINDDIAFDIYASPPHLDEASLTRRPPIVTIMGHVDHGKTTLLDTLRSESVAKGEAGGITQHIGAFSVPVPSAMDSSDIPQTITFLDTPGHAAFSAMRARGAQVTDIIVLVVAADDGVMPQTKEVINLIKKDKDKVGVVVAINKVDKPGADVEKVQNALWAEGLELENMGGDVPSVEVSGLTGHGLDDLVETISLLAELQDIRSEVDGPAHGFVLESKVIRGSGNTATVLLTRGQLIPSSHIIAGTTFAKIRQLTDSSGLTVEAAGPGEAVIVSGWKELPSAGDEVLQGKESDVKRAVYNRRRKASLEATMTDAEAINTSRRLEREERERKAEEEAKKTTREVVRAPAKASGPKELRLIIKGDVSGSIEALSAAVECIGNKDAVTKVIATGVGEVTESDVMHAKAAEGMVIAFSVNVSRMADQAASQNEVPIYSSNIIYNALDEVKERIIKLLPPIIEKRVCGEANVLQIFEISGKRKSIIQVAGCRVSNGLVEKDKRVRVLRNGKIIHEGTLSTLRILKRDVMEVKKGLECGINIANFSDLRAGDFLQFYQEFEKPGLL